MGLRRVGNCILNSITGHGEMRGLAVRFLWQPAAENKGPSSVLPLQHRALYFTPHFHSTFHQATALAVSRSRHASFVSRSGPSSFVYLPPARMHALTAAHRLACPQGHILGPAGDMRLALARKVAA